MGDYTEENPELAALRAENEQLKEKVEKLDYANSRMCAKIVRLDSIVRESQATIERLREGAEALAQEWDTGHYTPATEAVLRTCAIDLRNFIDSALASAKQE